MHANMYINTYIGTRIHVHMYIYAYTYTYTCMYTENDNLLSLSVSQISNKSFTFAFSEVYINSFAIGSEIIAFCSACCTTETLRTAGAFVLLCI